MQFAFAFELWSLLSNVAAKFTHVELSLEIHPEL